MKRNTSRPRKPRRPRKPNRVRKYTGRKPLLQRFSFPPVDGKGSLFDLEAQFHNEEGAETYFINKRWPEGPHCPDCGSVKVYDSKLKSRRLTRFKCYDCAKQFTVTSGTVMEGTKLPLGKWMKAYHRIGGSKKGIPARQLARELGIGLRSAWHLGHRIRATMADNGQRFTSGIVESDEAYIGGKRRGYGRGYRGNKMAVQTIVERRHGKGGRGTNRYRGGSEGFDTSECTNECPGRAQTIALDPEAERVDGRTVGAKLRAHTDPENVRLMTDESPIYAEVGKSFKSHERVHHKKGDYAHIEPHSGRLVSTNAAEGLFANLKRQITGTHHSVSKKHLPRYLEEYDHKYNNRDKSDIAITEAAIGKMEGKRVKLFKSKVGGDSLISYAHDEHPKHGTMRGMHAKRKRMGGEGEGGK